ncbi:hypothetical protein ACQPYA_00110 [Micromonospora sp. CA-263727]|uniref:hypothetical protein n=1 Tax=Micromonospora sp. CA-263727 TaxID=3239967 RepID=UPI003D8EA589
MTVPEDLVTDVERRRRRREERRELLRRLEAEAAGPPPFKVTLTQARARWPEWEAAHDDRREKGLRSATEKFGPVAANLLLDIHLPPLPSPTEIVAFALTLECGHEDFSLVKRTDEPKPPPERAPCPIYWSCQLNDGRTAIRYVEPGEPEPEHAGLGLTLQRWSVTLACGHASSVLRAENEESRVGDFMVCRMCAPEDPDADVEIVALGKQLPDVLVQSWKVELNCGHLGTDHFIPVSFQNDPAAYRAQHPRRKGLRCIDQACHEREVRKVRRLGVLGKIRAQKPAATPPDPVALAARDLRRRLTKQERQALVRELQADNERR